MAYPFAVSDAVGGGTGAEQVDCDNGLSDLLGPLLAGARARGVADAFEMLGLAAVLIDGTGRVLHAGGRAQRALGPLVRIVEDHLVGSDATVNNALQTLISGAVGSGGLTGAGSEVSLFGGEGSASRSVRAIRIPEGSCDASQLLKAVLIVTETGACTPL